MRHFQSALTSQTLARSAPVRDKEVLELAETQNNKEVKQYINLFLKK
jgi:hypothetical protein